MREHKMTKWDEGQVLIKASDTLFECASELRATQPGFADMLHHMGCQIGTEFERFESHAFGLRTLQDCTCATCKVKKESHASR
jgi:hypothetical protein